MSVGNRQGECPLNVYCDITSSVRSVLYCHEPVVPQKSWAIFLGLIFGQAHAEGVVSGLYREGCGTRGRRRRAHANPKERGGFHISLF